MINSFTTPTDVLPHRTPEVPASGLVLKSGSIGNARVSVEVTPTGLRVVKDFSTTPFLIRHLLGRFLIWREYVNLRRLQGLPGVPADPVRIHAFALSYRFVSGETLATVLEQRLPLPAKFFTALEQLVLNLHARGFSHLDLRNGRNILCAADGQPCLLDFQAGLWLRFVPALLRRPFERSDLSGVYKWWNRLAPGQLDPERARLLQVTNRWRVLWRFNYPTDSKRLRH